MVDVILVHGLSSLIRQEGPRMDSGHIYLVCYDLVWVFLSGPMQQLVPGWRWTGGRYALPPSGLLGTSGIAAREPPTSAPPARVTESRSLVATMVATTTG